MAMKNSAEECFGKALVQIRFSALNLMYYDKSSIKAITVKVDLTTQNVARGNYAWVCVEVDLALTLVDCVWINDH